MSPSRRSCASWAEGEQQERRWASAAEEVAAGTWLQLLLREKTCAARGPVRLLGQPFCGPSW